MKLLFRRSNGVAIHRLVGEKVVEWLNVELPKVSNPRVDMLGRTESGALVHLEMQSRNEDRMEVRELDYYSGFFRLFNQHVRQVMLYIGAAPLNMASQLQTPVLTYRYELMDIREFDGEALVNSSDLGDAMLALLTYVDKERVCARVLPELERLPSGTREDIATEFLIISGLRGLEHWVLEKVRALMPLSIDVILDNKVIGPAFLRRVEECSQEASREARREALQEGRQEGRQEGESAMLRRLLEARFGPLPAEFEVQLQHAAEERLNTIADRALTASSLEEAFRTQNGAK